MDSLNDAVALFRVGKINDAADAFQRLVDADPARADGWYYLALLSHQAKDLDAAMERLAPSFPEGIRYDIPFDRGGQRKADDERAPPAGH